MPIHLRENQYKGVNAHLHSYLQQHGEWSIFHSIHITHLSAELQTLLPPESGYLALPEGFDTDDEEDQTRIKARMAAVKEAHEQTN